jgi:tRNA-(ms[2]io[6]A)-hydroxylase
LEHKVQFALEQMDKESTLPLRYQTPASWARFVLCAPLELLNDHAHLEKKAAANALELLHRWPEPKAPENWVAAMTAIARDEVEHLALVTRILSRRGGILTKQHRNPYANELRMLVRKGMGSEELVDRLLVSALIEARSAERFKLLAEACEDGELAKLYRGLWGSEQGHYRAFLDLAGQVLETRTVEARWRQLLDEEATIIQRQGAGARMHSGVEIAAAGS